MSRELDSGDEFLECQTLANNRCRCILKSQIKPTKSVTNTQTHKATHTEADKPSNHTPRNPQTHKTSSMQHETKTTPKERERERERERRRENERKEKFIERLSDACFFVSIGSFMKTEKHFVWDQLHVDFC